MSKIDTVREKYYRPLERAESAGGFLFWAVSVLSIATLFIDGKAYPLPYNLIQAMFVACVVLFFVQGQALRLYFFPRAEGKRRQELLSNSFSVPLTHEKTVGYYNNAQTDPLKRLAASVMESSFFTNAIAHKMLANQRTITFGYLFIYIVAAINRSTDLGIIAIAAQVLFSEDIFSRWLRMEWLRIRSEQVFDNLNRLFSSNHSFIEPSTQSQAIDFFSFYETTKSTAAILLSSKHFRANNDRLSEEWKQICYRLNI